MVGWSPRDFEATPPKPKQGALPEKKLDELLKAEEIILDTLDQMPEDIVEGYRPHLKILGEMIQKALEAKEGNS